MQLYAICGLESGVMFVIPPGRRRVSGVWCRLRGVLISTNSHYFDTTWFNSSSQQFTLNMCHARRLDRWLCFTTLSTFQHATVCELRLRVRCDVCYSARTPQDFRVIGPRTGFAMYVVLCSACVLHHCLRYAMRAVGWLFAQHRQLRLRSEKEQQLELGT